MRAHEASDPSSAAAAYRAECDDELRRARDALDELERSRAPHTVSTVLDPLDLLLMLLDRGLGNAAFRRDVHPDPAVRAVASHAEQELQQLSTALHLSRPLYDALRGVDASAADPATRRWLERLLRDFRRAGVDRDAPTRARVRALQDALVKSGQEFSRNIREDVRAISVEPYELAGMPADWLRAHPPGPDGRVRVTTDYPDYVPFMTYAASDSRRRELYVAYRRRGVPANLEVLSRLIAQRHELARTLGYTSWAAYATEDKMMKSPERAAALVERVSALARPRARRDYDELLVARRRVDPAAREVADWQKTFLEEAVKRERYAFDSREAREYFAYDDVERGVLATVGRLFGLDFRRVDGPVWHPSVKAFEVHDATGPVGRCWLDMHPRDGKYKHAAMFPLQAGVAGRRLPEAVLVCNFPGGDGTRGLLEHAEVETFFHELGHLVHHLLGGRQRWVGQSGIATEWDFVEAPSQLLEEWAWDPTTLGTFARNARGEPIPAALVERMRAARDFGKGIWAAQQMFYAALSLRLYSGDPAGLDTTAVVREVQARYSPFAYVDDTHMQASFGHLDGYSAVYYTYMWSLVIARDLLTAFAPSGLADGEVARRYRRAVLEPGGSRDAADLVRDFLGRDVAFDAFAGWLEAAPGAPA